MVIGIRGRFQSNKDRANISTNTYGTRLRVVVYLIDRCIRVSHRSSVMLRLWKRTVAYSIWVKKAISSGIKLPSTWARVISSYTRFESMETLLRGSIVLDYNWSSVVIIHTVTVNFIKEISEMVRVFIKLPKPWYKICARKK